MTMRRSSTSGMVFVCWSWRRESGSCERRHPDHANISEWLDGYNADELDVFPIQIALGRIAARRNAAAKRILKNATD